MIRARLALRLALSALLAGLALTGTGGYAQSAKPAAATEAAGGVLRVGSKRFTESYILGEVLAQTAGARAKAEHRSGLGNTAIVFEALKSGSIDLYPEYTGTIALEILKASGPLSLAEMDALLAKQGLGVAVPLGFNNSYALALRGVDAVGLRVARLSDLAAHASLRFGLSHEFLGRADGWPGLAQAYQLPQQPLALDHGLAYDALAKRQVDVIDIYATDAKIERLGLGVLQDDRGYFPRYEAVILYRRDLPRRFPRAWAALKQLEGRIDAPKMIAMNAQAELESRPFAVIARDFLARNGLHGAAPAGSGPANARGGGLYARLFDGNLWTLTRQHVFLVLASLLAACAIGLPLGVLAQRVEKLKQPVMLAVGVLQTIPSLALLAMLIPLLGAIGTVPALVALFVYALLPIVRNTAAGLAEVPRGMRDAGIALGLSPKDRLLSIELPLALPVILAGVKTAAVINVGTATIAAFIGAGGYGERIATGLALNDNDMLLAGAIPAALLAVLTQWGFEAGEKLLLRRPRQ
jgi:osmoprotectant transport system permease protein